MYLYLHLNLYLYLLVCPEPGWKDVKRSPADRLLLVNMEKVCHRQNQASDQSFQWRNVSQSLSNAANNFRKFWNWVKESISANISCEWQNKFAQPPPRMSQLSFPKIQGWNLQQSPTLESWSQIWTLDMLLCECECVQREMWDAATNFLHTRGSQLTVLPFSPKPLATPNPPFLPTLSNNSLPMQGFTLWSPSGCCWVAGASVRAQGH